MATHYLNSVSKAYSTDNINFKTAQEGANIEYNASTVSVHPTHRFGVTDGFIAPSFSITPASDIIFLDGVQKVAGTYTITTLLALLQSVFPKASGAGASGTGINSDGTYTADATTHYISTATSLANADKLLDTQLFTDTTNIASNTSDIASNTTAIATKQTSFTPTAVLTGSYTAQPNDLVRTDATSGNIAITLANNPADKSRIAIKQIGVGGSFTTTFTCSGIDVLNKAGGSTSGTLTLLNQAVIIQYDAANHIWVATGDDIPLSQLDLRYSPISTDTRTSLYLGAMTSTTRDAIGSPVVGNTIFNTTTNMLEIYQDALLTWMPVSGAQSVEWQRKYGFGYHRTFATNSADQHINGVNGNSGANISGQAITGATSETSNVIALSLPTTTNAFTGYLSSGAGFTVGSGVTVYEVRINILNLSTGTDRFWFMAGFYDVLAVNQSDSISLLYDEGGLNTGSTATPNWQLLTSSNSSRTFGQTSTAVAAATWLILRIEINAAASSVSFFVNGALVGSPATATIPSGVARSFGFGMLAVKALGTTTRNVLVNYLSVIQKYTTPRS